MSPAVELFVQLDSMVGMGGYPDTAAAWAAMEARFGFDVVWRPSASGPVAEVVAFDVADPPMRNATRAESDGVSVDSLCVGLARADFHARPATEAERVPNLSPR